MIETIFPARKPAVITAEQLAEPFTRELAGVHTTNNSRGYNNLSLIASVSPNESEWPVHFIVTKDRVVKARTDSLKIAVQVFNSLT